VISITLGIVFLILGAAQSDPSQRSQFFFWGGLSIVIGIILVLLFGLV
jgi:hypothetical protein